MHNPLDQFQVKKIIDINVMGIDISFTNSSLMMLTSVFCIIIFVYLATNNTNNNKPLRVQSAAEYLYNFIVNMLRDNIGNTDEVKKFVPLVFMIFCFITMGNLFGMIPYSFTFTSHVIVTFILAAFLFVVVTVAGFTYHGMHFLRFFLPSGTPAMLAPLIIIIEFFTYMSRPLTLSMRLAANMMAGHILLKVIASFSVMLGILGWIPVPFMVLLTGFEIFVSLLQAYIFSILLCVYINDSVNLH